MPAQPRVPQLTVAQRVELVGETSVGERTEPAAVRRSARTATFQKALLLVAAGVATGALLTWATLTVMLPARELTEVAQYATAEVSFGEIQESIATAGSATWDPGAAGVNRSSGIVTAVHAQDGSELSSGSVVYEVNERPVVLATGVVPAFRDMARGINGDDVAQLQSMLTQLGFYGGDIDGEFGPQTADAVRSWQRGLGLEGTGIVLLGDLMFIPDLPAQARVDGEILFRDATLSGGERVLEGLAGAPAFYIDISAARSSLIVEGMTVQLSYVGVSWSALVGARGPGSEDGSVRLHLASVDDVPICRDECRVIPTEGNPRIDAQVIVMPVTAGLVVPSSAVWTNEKGELVVIAEDGEQHVVEVVAQARGLSLVNGVAEGQIVRVPAVPEGGAP